MARDLQILANGQWEPYRRMGTSVWWIVVLGLSYPAVSSVFALMRLLPMSDVDKYIEILMLRYELVVLQGQFDRPRVTPADRAFLAPLLHRLPRLKLRQLHLIVSPDTVLRWHRDLRRRRHAGASRRKRPGRPPTRRSIQPLVLRLARENTSWGYRRIRGELAVLGIKVAPSTAWEILRAPGIEPRPERDRLGFVDSSVRVPGRCPESIRSCRTHFRSVLVESLPSFSSTAFSAAS
ncbi:hypothetical protein ACFVXA_24895 [Streptomyces sp. NPDC058246]|uniref:hypothetical protein n=1 Tax=Streptomyces sp. NPDC058246 TaxID=3346400 RepID=UPI0036E2CD72